jgi:hypothetical protein
MSGDIIGTSALLEAAKRRARRDRILFLVGVLNAPTGISRPSELIRKELDELIHEEWPDWDA